MPQLTPLSCQRHAMGLRLRQELRICSMALRRINQIRARRCESAWNKDPVMGVIGVQ
jgi:hypothetical protein